MIIFWIVFSRVLKVESKVDKIAPWYKMMMHMVRPFIVNQKKIMKLYAYNYRIWISESISLLIDQNLSK